MNLTVSIIESGNVVPKSAVEHYGHTENIEGGHSGVSNSLVMSLAPKQLVFVEFLNRHLLGVTIAPYRGH